MKEFFFVENTQKDTQETTKVQEGNQQTAQETAYNHTLVASTAQQTARLAQKHQCRGHYARCPDTRVQDCGRTKPAGVLR